MTSTCPPAGDVAADLVNGVASMAADMGESSQCHEAYDVGS